MKKISFLIPFLCILISSCSSDNDPISQNTDLDPVKYTVNLNVKSAGFEVDKTPIKSSNWNRYSFLQVIVYNESGTVYSDSIIDPTTLQALVNENNTPQISLELPKGNYFLSILNRRMFAASDSKIEDFVIIPNNYETDYYNRKLNGFSGNQYIYYYTNSLTVTSDSNNLDSITLAPMWSTIQSPVVKYAPDFVTPVGSSRIYDQIAPTYFGFGIKSKLAKIPHSYIFKEFDHFDAGYVSSPFPVIVSEAEDSNLSLEICYIKSDDGYSGGRVLKIQKINLNTIVKNGMNYTISGTIPAIDSIDSNFMNIGLEPFKDSNIKFQ